MPLDFSSLPNQSGFLKQLYNWVFRRLWNLVRAHSCSLTMGMMIIKAVITPTSKKAFHHLLTYNKYGWGDSVSPDLCISCDRPQNPQPPFGCHGICCAEGYRRGHICHRGAQSVTNPPQGRIRGVPPSYRELIQIQTLQSIILWQPPEQPTDDLSDHLLVLILSSLNVCLYEKSMVLKLNEVLYGHQHDCQRN